MTYIVSCGALNSTHSLTRGQFLQATTNNVKTLKDKMVCWDTKDQSRDICSENVKERK